MTSITKAPNLPANSVVPADTLLANMPSSWKESAPVNFTMIPETPTDLPSLGAAGSGSDRQVASWTLVPDAFGVTNPLGADFYVQAKISYTYNGIPKSITTTQELITVHPQPKIMLDYYIPRYLYEDEAADWLVVATNVGYGPARNFSMEKPKPKIIKQSDQYPTSYSYDAGDNLLVVNDALTGTTTFAYDNVGNRLSMTDALNRQIGVIDALSSYLFSTGV